MDLASAADRASKLWNTFPALRFAFVDSSALAQTLLGPDTLKPSRAAEHELIASRCVAGAERLALVRNPLFAPPQSSYIERNRNALIVWLYGPLTARPDPEGGCDGTTIADAIERNADASTLVFRICSHGGRATALMQVLNAIARFKGRSIALIDGFAISAAADIACACDRLVMRDGSVLRLHRTSTTAAGDHAHLSSVAAELRVMDDGFAVRIAKKRGMSYDAVRELMRADRFVSVQEALAIGLCDASTRSIDGTATFIHRETGHVG